MKRRLGHQSESKLALWLKSKNKPESSFITSEFNRMGGNWEKMVSKTPLDNTPGFSVIIEVGKENKSYEKETYNKQYTLGFLKFFSGYM